MTQNPAHENSKMDVGDVGLKAGHWGELGPEPASSRIVVADLFPADRRNLPVEMEIGSGKGTFLVTQSRSSPLVNYLGVEYAQAFWRYAADRCRRQDLQNVRLINIDAQVLVNWRLPDACVNRVHIYFPDPWPKKRHHKRRLIQADFLRQVHRVLEPAGQLRIVTDHEGYFSWMQDHLGQTADLWTEIPFERAPGTDEGEVVGTNFERKYRREGRPFYALARQKIWTENTPVAGKTSSSQFFPPR